METTKMEMNDHRRLGNELELYHIQENAPGMVFWHPHGFAIYRLLEDYIRGKMKRLGFREVRTPQLLPKELWERSGHWDKFGNNMFCVPVEDGKSLALKPMSCPCHIQIFNQGIKSWRELPVRYSEFGACHRNETSGSMHGLMRTRAFEQDDAHVLCRNDQVRNEVSRFIGLLSQVYQEFGFVDYKVALSTRPEIRAGSDELWDWAEQQLAEAAEDRGLSYSIQEGEGAFYGPKLEFILQDRQGREWQCGTVQLDTVLPNRLGATYVDENGNDSTPMMIHHAVFGSMGRFVAILLEHWEGALPFWLSPTQVAILPISAKHTDASNSLCDELLAQDIRAVTMNNNDTLQRRIVEASKLKVPVMIVIGDKELSQSNLSIRHLDGQQQTIPRSSLIDRLAQM